MSAPDLVVWDFDGVLNRTIVDGRLPWAETLQADLGLDPAAFVAHIFEGDRIHEIVRGRLCLRETVADWLAPQPGAPDADTFLAYWFERDGLPDDEVIGWLEAHPGRRVIGTNNETLRAAHIEHGLGFAAKVERVFCSGRLGVAKPDVAFFEAIEDWAGLPPERILLVDDSAANVAAADALGWRTFHFTAARRALLPGALGL
jgi:putative hydrolase of the HAD superfamily